MTICTGCNAGFHAADRFCTQCGAPRPSVDELQPAFINAGAGAEYEDGDQSGTVAAGSSDLALSANTVFASVQTFWLRHYVLIVISYIAALGLFALDWVTMQAGDGGRVAVIALALASLLAWPFAAIRSEKTLSAASVADNWFYGLSDTLASSDSRIFRWLLFPVVWVGGKFMELSRFVKDPFASASIRVLCYALTLFTLVGLIIFAFAVIVALLIIGISLMILSFFLGGDTEMPRLRRPMRAGRRGAGDIIEGGNWLEERKTGRVDEDGNIYEGGNWLTERKVGRVDEDGNVYEGSNWLNEQKVGRVGDDGEVYEGSNWLTEEKVGRVDEDGTVYEGKGWLSEKKVGRHKKPD